MSVLRRAYPDGIPKDELSSVMALLAETGMSVRSVAAVMGFYYDRPYVEFYMAASAAEVDAAGPDSERILGSV